MLSRFPRILVLTTSSTLHICYNLLMKYFLHWLRIAVLVAIALHAVFILYVFIHDDVIPNSICSNIEGFDKHPCTSSDIKYDLQILATLSGFSLGLSFLAPVVIVFTVGITWSYVKRKITGSNQSTKRY